MGFPGEELVSSALESFSKGAIQKMEESEARRDREFSYKLKELEFYKGNYNKEIKSIFDRWFGLLKNSLSASKGNIKSGQQKNQQAKTNDYLKPEKVLDLLVDTMKYGGTETGKALAVFCQVSYYNEKEDNTPLNVVYAVCVLLSTLKQEILGQEIAPDTILKILRIDYIEKWDEVNESRAYVEGVRKELFPEDNDDGAVV